MIKDERTSIIKDAMKEGVNESVRIFLASKIDQYVVNQKCGWGNQCIRSRSSK